MRFGADVQLNKLKTLGSWLGLALTWPFSYLLAVPSQDYAPSAGGVTLQLLIAAILAILLLRSPTVVADNTESLLSGRFWSHAGQLVLPAIALAGFFFFHAWKRSTYAPPGSDVAFLLVLTPLFVYAMAIVSERKRLAWETIIGISAAILGGIAIVANWESPSSFSPFTRFIYSEMTILLAPVSLAVFVSLIRRGRIGTERLGTILFIAASMMLIVQYIVGQPFSISTLDSDALMFLTFAAILGVLLPVLFLTKLVERAGAVKSSTAFLMLPIVVTLMILVEQNIGFSYLPTPFAWPPIIAGAMVALTGVIAIWKN